VALDSAHDLLFIPAFGNGGFRAFQLDERGLPVDRQARFITSRESIYGRRSVPPTTAEEARFPGAGAIIDTSTERFFTVDRFANRILVYDGNPSRLGNLPSAEVVIGQPDFTSTRRGLGPNRLGAISGTQLDEENQRLFVSDGPNNRVLVFDVDPDRLTNDPRAVAVIGQDDLESRNPGIGPSKFNGPGSIAYDSVLERLFVSDSGNNRVLIFDVNPDNPDGLNAAIAVMGQRDFESRAPRESLDELRPAELSYDSRHQRLFMAEGLEHRIMVYDAHPDRVGGPARAIAVIGQPDAFSTHPAVSDRRVAMPRIAVDSEREKLYISEGYPAGNRVTVWDISPDNLETGMSALDVIGHETLDGAPDFFNRMAQGHLDGRSLAAARAVTLDPVDHRLFVPDEYNHRVVVWQLDDLNRIADRDARWVLGQPDLNTSLMGEPTARNMTTPIGAAYDTSTKRLFVGDGYHNRILVYDAAPGQLENGMPASVVIGQRDFLSVERAAGPAGINFGVRMGRGIASDFLPMGFAVDESGQRLFVSDGENNRVLIYDVRRDVLRNGAEAIGILGQRDFQSTAPGSGAGGFYDPGHLAYDGPNERLFVIDAKHKRVLVFDVHPDRFENAAFAIAVLGKTDFETPALGGPGIFGATPGRPLPINGSTFVAPNGIAHDPVKQLLYVSDGGGTFGIPADRILVFDVHPDRLENGAAAVATLGAPDAETPAPTSWGGPEPIPGQFRVRDTRGIALDHENGRLFATGSFESRIVQFNFPRARWRYLIEPAALQSFGTLDAADLGGRSDPETLTVARLNARSGAVPAAVAVYSLSRQTVDQRSERHSRRLIGEAAVAPSAPTRQASVFVHGSRERTHELYFYNPGRRTAELTLELRDDQGVVQRQWRRTVAPGQQLAVELESLGAFEGDATLSIGSNVALAIAAFRLTSNGHDDVLLAPAPMTLASAPSERTTIPYLITGGGHWSEVVLINPTDELMEGTVTFHNNRGEREPLGNRSAVLAYRIPPHSSRTMPSDGAGPVARQGYAVIAPRTGGAPHSMAILQRRYGDVLASESLVEGSHSTEAQFGIDLRPTLVRHGDMDTRLIVVNPNAETATVDFRLAGQESIRRIVAPGEQVIVSVLAELGENVHGIIELSSNLGVTVTVRRSVTNIRAELIESELPALAVESIFPYVPNGGGLSTEFRFANRSAESIDGYLEFILPDGGPANGTILR